MEYPVDEIFVSVQGEGHNVGMPMVFVRFLGCNLQCPYCDTQQRQITEKDLLTEDEIIEKVRILSEGKMVRYVCVTGGEPTIRNIIPLAKAIRRAGRLLAIETNGTNKIPDEVRPNWLTVSPKWPPGLVAMRQYCGDEIKIPVTPELPKSDVIKLFHRFGAFKHYFLQPVDNPVDKEGFKDNVERALELSYLTGARISGQLHKRLGIA